ncbi:hypothetical protein P3G55_10180 [Leptospira sp. 96542]|nr:hypothetical protein [Leptospira sp. 96542]
MNTLIGFVPSAEEAAWILSMTIEVSIGLFLQKRMTKTKKTKLILFKRLYPNKIKVSKILKVGSSKKIMYQMKAVENFIPKIRITLNQISPIRNRTLDRKTKSENRNSDLVFFK